MNNNEPSCEFYKNLYPEYLSKIFENYDTSMLLPINAYSQISKPVPEKDQELFIAYLYIENLLKQILLHHFDEIRSVRFDGEEFPKIHLGTVWSPPHPNVIYTTKEIYSVKEWGNVASKWRNVESRQTVTTKLSDDQKDFINKHFNVVINTMGIKFGPYWNDSPTGGATRNFEEAQKLMSEENNHYLPKIREHIAQEMDVAIDPSYGQPLVVNSNE
jgi:hypothetical protein